jgi:hypothetical protein
MMRHMIRQSRQPYEARNGESALFIMTTSAWIVEPVIQVKAVRDDPNDDHVVSCAIAAGAEAIKMLRLGEFLRRGQGKG